MKIPKHLGSLVSGSLLLFQSTTFAWTNEQDTRTCRAGGRVDTSPRKNFEWKVTSDEWSEQDEAGYSEWVRAIGRTQCGNLTSCIRSAGNPLRSKEDEGLVMYTDCADLPYQMRAYFAWKKGLPFTYANGFFAVNGKSQRPEVSRLGNYATERTFVTSNGVQSKSVPVEPAYINQILFEVCRQTNSGSWRMDAFEHSKRPGEIDGDFYPAKIGPANVRPGTVLYNPDGHVSVVYDVIQDANQGMGRILLLSAHPGEVQTPLGSLSRTEFGPSEMAFSKHQVGHGFKNFRPLRRAADGALTVAPDSEIPDFSLEQYSSEFELEGMKLGYFQYVRAQMAGGVAVLFSQMELEFKQMTSNLCTRLKDRITSVEGVRKLAKSKKAPVTLPDNIFNSTSDEFWEGNSSPSRDTRLRKASADFRAQIEFYLRYTQAKCPGDEARQLELKKMISTIILEGSASCPLSYINSNEKAQIFTIEDVLRGRVLRMSFDPYHCPELRWGATDPKELSSCQMLDPRKWEWYAAEQRFRNMLETNSGARMFYTLEQTQSRGRSNVWGTWDEPKVNPFELLE